ncbi:MAG: FAD-binding oxidoreductase [Hyphomicrobiaceae bacterium]
MSKPKQPVVIGAGIIGASIAYGLAKAGTPPVIIDAGPDGGLATQGSLAWINASWGNPEPYFRLRMRSIEEWRRLGTLWRDLPLRWTGSLTYDMPLPDLDRYVAQHRDWGYRIRLIRRQEIATREPRLTEIPEEAAFCEDEGMVEPVPAAQMFRQAAVELGATYHAATSVTAIDTKGRSVSGVVTGEGTIPADHVVVASGVAAPELLAPLGIGLPLTAPEGLLVHTEPMPAALRTIIVAPDFHVRQTVEGRLVAGFDFVGTVIGTPAKAAQRLIRRLNETLDLPEPARLAHTTMEQRPTPADGFPAVGFLPQVEGLYVAVTHSGMTLAPALGLMAAAELTGARRDPLLAPYGPARFAA